MNLKRICAIYAILVGLSMFATWGGFFITGSVMGVKPVATGIGFHIVSELATGFALLAAGAGLIANREWARNVYFLGMGLMIYAVVNSP
jgi:hypothetical protein